jgi:hypothetical protein
MLKIETRDEMLARFVERAREFTEAFAPLLPAILGEIEKL